MKSLKDLKNTLKLAWKRWRCQHREETLEVRDTRYVNQKSVTRLKVRICTKCLELYELQYGVDLVKVSQAELARFRKKLYTAPTRSTKGGKRK